MITSNRLVNASCSRTRSVRTEGCALFALECEGIDRKPEKVNPQRQIFPWLVPSISLAELCECLTNLRDFNNGNAGVFNSGTSEKIRSILVCEVGLAHEFECPARGGACPHDLFRFPQSVVFWGDPSRGHYLVRADRVRTNSTGNLSGAATESGYPYVGIGIIDLAQKNQEIGRSTTAWCNVNVQFVARRGLWRPL